MAENKTQTLDASVGDYLRAVEPERRREEGLALDALFRDVTGWEPVLWGASPTSAMIGYGRYDYQYKSGRSGSFFATGFSPRKAKLSIYIMPGYQDYGAILDRLGKHALGKSCLYINKLDDVDTNVLKELVRAGLDDLGKMYPVAGS
jgi:hypothetical protein